MYVLCLCICCTVTSLSSEWFEGEEKRKRMAEQESKWDIFFALILAEHQLLPPNLHRRKDPNLSDAATSHSNVASTAHDLRFSSIHGTRQS